MPVHLYSNKNRWQQLALNLPGVKPESKKGLNLTESKLKIMDDYMCDAATRNTRGRLYQAFEEDALRTPFERDTQRILSSPPFFRLEGKTMVYPLRIDLSVHSRLTHSSEVAKIARSLAFILRLNPDLAEAIGFGHDLGTGPFGHAGETFLDTLKMRDLGIFHKHNIQGLVLIDELYINPSTRQRLDLTFETRDGIICHVGKASEREIIPYGAYEGEIPKDSSLSDLKKCNVEILEEHRKFFPGTLEGAVAREADHIASAARDPENAVTLKIIEWKDLPQICQDTFKDENGRISASSIIKKLSQSVIDNSWNVPHQSVYSIRLGDKEAAALESLHLFNVDNIYSKIRHTNKFLRSVPKICNTLYNNFLQQGQTPQEAIDHISFMTDIEAIKKSVKIKKNLRSQLRGV